MMYVIKNCPNYYYDKDWECPHRCNLTDGDWDCVNDDYGFNCLLKQIVEKCKLAKQGIGLSMKNFADELLKMLEIEEVNE